ncbi:recombinase XerC [Campylobacter lari]|nr:recombinase XerC [Campylobacter lari]EAK0794639.1 recombinase XerC [Campylobacter lari]EAK9875844.1 recombinase XerC [Campylobacter lari]MCV3394766.1 tyrosine-type recombinase/integrase [Campylobacter lari]MCV3413449.1 tyrosine-type recombinase/integrase [Campylobacter lari]
MKLKKGNISQDLERWVRAYFNHLKTLSYSNNTILLYERILLEFVEYSLDFQDEMQINDIKTLFIVNFLDFLEKRSKNVEKLSKKTKLTYLRIISSFFTFINDNNDDFYQFNFNLSKLKIRTEKAEEKIEYLNENEITSLLNVLEKEKARKDDYNSYRNALLVKLMLFAGLRISEALKVSLSDFIEDDDEVTRISIFGKGGKEQFAYIKTSKIADELEYFKEHLNINDCIMKTAKNKILSRSNTFVIINRIYAKALIAKKGLHLLRHTFAMRLTNKGTNLVFIQKLLRHSNIKTTTIYSKADKENTKKALIETN